MASDLWDPGQEWILIFDSLLKHPQGVKKGCQCDICGLNKGICSQRRASSGGIKDHGGRIDGHVSQDQLEQGMYIGWHQREQSMIHPQTFRKYFLQFMQFVSAFGGSGYMPPITEKFSPKYLTQNLFWKGPFLSRWNISFYF